MDGFKRLGVLGDWENRYATMDYSSEAAIVAEFHKFVASGQLYRGSKPVMWSPVERTALADAEVEYHDHVSPTIWVKFPSSRVRRRPGSPAVVDLDDHALDHPGEPRGHYTTDRLRGLSWSRPWRDGWPFEPWAGAGATG
jgi:isoleucyl-tRNA synthetase